jgi:polygalacturonase
VTRCFINRLTSAGPARDIVHLWVDGCLGLLPERIDGITIQDSSKRLNSDGMDPNSCKDVRITRCHIVCGDDAIVLKITQPLPCEDIEVSDCVLESATAGCGWRSMRDSITIGSRTWSGRTS